MNQRFFSSGNTVVSDLKALVSSIEKCQTITLSSQLPIIKTSTLSMIVDEFLLMEKQVHYVDLDLQYSSMLCNGLENQQRVNQLLEVFRSSDKSTVDLVISLLNSSDSKTQGIIIIDSINTLQTLLQEKEHKMDFVKSNHEAAVLITLIQEFASEYSKTLILANVTRPRPKEGQDSRLWDREISGGRMIRLKSDAILSASENSDDLHARGARIELKVESVAERCKANLTVGQSFSFLLNPFTWR